VSAQTLRYGSVAALMPLAGLLGVAAGLHQTELLIGLGAALAVGVVALAWRAQLLDWWALALVALLSANYNVFLNANAFIAGGADRGRTITIAATIGFALFTVALNERRRARAIPWRPSPADALAGAFVVAACVAFVVGLRRDNPQVYLLGDFGQILQLAAAYVAVRLYALVAGPVGMRSFLVLLGLSWGLRAAAELLFPEARGTALIVLDGERLFRRTDPLGPLALPLLLGLTMSERRADRASLLLGSALLVAAQNVLGFTRAHYLALGVAVPFVLLIALAHREGRGRLGSAAPFLGLTLIVAYAVLTPARVAVDDAWARFEEAFDSQTRSRIHREAENEAVLGAIRKEPVLGQGLGTEYRGIDPFTLAPTEVHFVHNDYLALWLRGGVLLVGTWVALLTYAVWRGVTAPSALGSLASAGAAAGVLGAAVTAIVSGSAFGYVAGPITALMIVAATWRAAEEPQPVDEPSAVELRPATTRVLHMRAEARLPAFDAAEAAAVCPACLGAIDAAGPAMRTCPACRTVSFWPLPSAAELDTFYNGDYTVTDAGLTHRRRDNWLPLLDMAASRARGRKGLEIGSSTGAFLRFATENGWQMTGVELDGRAREHSLQHEPSVPVWASLAGARAEPSTSWDAVWLLHTIEHFLDPEAVLREVRAALLPKGVLVITTPNGDSLQRRLLGSLWEWWTPPAHLALFSPLGAEVLLERAGFEVLSVETRRGDSTGTAANLLLAPARWLKRRGEGRQQRSSARAASQRVAALVNAIYDPLSWPVRRRLYRDLLGPELLIVARRPAQRRGRR
jgi:SAM-dependent methyltransferase